MVNFEPINTLLIISIMFMLFKIEKVRKSKLEVQKR